MTKHTAADFAAARICSVGGCEGAARTRGYCNKHYLRFWKYGDPLAGGPEVTHRNLTECTVDGCGRPYSSRGYCSTHARRAKRFGEPLADTPISVAYKDPGDALAARTVERPNGCIEWTGATSPAGYGRIVVDGRLENAHRVAWERQRGRIPEGLYVDHICHNPPCVNPEHLRLATPQQNVFHRDGPDPTSTTGIRNVHRGKRPGTYAVYVGRDGKYHYGGTFSDIEAAAVRAEELRQELHGEFAGKGR